MLCRQHAFVIRVSYVSDDDERFLFATRVFGIPTHNARTCRYRRHQVRAFPCLRLLFGTRRVSQRHYIPTRIHDAMRSCVERRRVSTVFYQLLQLVRLRTAAVFLIQINAGNTPSSYRADRLPKSYRAIYIFGLFRNRARVDSSCKIS